MHDGEMFWWVYIYIRWLCLLSPSSLFLEIVSKSTTARSCLQTWVVTDSAPEGGNYMIWWYDYDFLCPLAGYVKSRQAVANFYSCPEAPLEAEVCFFSLMLSHSSAVPPVNLYHSTWQLNALFPHCDPRKIAPSSIMLINQSACLVTVTLFKSKNRNCKG